MNFKICLAQESDLMDVYNLSNDPIVRESSFNKTQILLQDHVKWFNDKLQNKNYIFYVVRSENDVFIGQVRFDLISQEKCGIYKVSISLVSDYRGKGLASKVLKSSTEKLIRNYKAKKIYAYIKAINIASIKAFLKAGYVQDFCLKQEAENSSVLKFVYKVNN